MGEISWLKKREEVHIRKNKFNFETYKVYDTIFYNKISCAEII